MAKLKRMKKEMARQKRYLKHFKAAGPKHAMKYGEWIKSGESQTYFKGAGLRRRSLEAQLRESGVSKKDIQKLTRKR